MLRDLNLNTVCCSAKCPNEFECFSRSVATFLVMGPVCTRNCAFCNITPGAPAPLDEKEPERVAEASARLGLSHVVVTSVTRDDLEDGGAAHFAAVIRAVRARLPRATVEVLTPDFQGDGRALGLVLAEEPEVFNHNVETAPSLYPRIRPRADYGQSLAVLRAAAERGGKTLVKSGLMAGLGETPEELREVIGDLREAGCHIVTVGQYMRPSKEHPAVERWVHPDEFETLGAFGRSLGIPHVYSAPLVRSSYNASLFLDREKHPDE